MRVRFSGQWVRGSLAALALLTRLGSADAGVPAGTPVFIQVQGFVPSSIALNGFVVSGLMTESGAFHWMPTSGVTLIGGISGYISRDGTTIVGPLLDANGYQQTAMWEGGTSWRVLGPLVPGAVPCDRTLSFPSGISGDGGVVVGGGYYSTNPARPCALFSAYRWEESTGFTVLGNLTGGFTRADAVSADGRVIVGYEEPPNATASGVKWVDGKQEFIQGPLGPVGFARAVNRDGSIIAGTGCTRDLPNQPPNAFTWTAAGGTKCHTVDPPLWIRWLRGYNYNLYIYAVNDDGRVMGGNVSFNLNAGEEESVIWFDGEPVFLRDYLRSHGYPDAFEGHHSTGRITAISADGRTLVGYNAGVFGTPNRNGFIVVLPELDK